MSDLSRHSCCPECHSREGYRLGDGRKKCCRCGKKYSRRHSRTRLSAKILKQISLYFWLGAPVATVARNLHLDRKTVRRHYDLMQQGIGTDEERFCHLVGDGENLESFCLLVNSESTWCERLSLPSQQHICTKFIDYWWWFSAMISIKNASIAVRCLVCIDQAAIESGEKSWWRDLEKFEKIVQGLCCKKSESGQKKRQLLMSEVAFRFNQRNNPGVTAELYRYLRS